MQKRIQLFASSYFGYATLAQLDKLGAYPDVVILASHVSRRKSFDDILTLSNKFNITEIDSQRYSYAKENLASADYIVTLDWRKDFFHDSQVDCPVYHAHLSLLPKYRGYGAVSEQFMRGVAVSGVSIYEENGKVDAGDIVFQQQVNILHEDLPASFIDNCAEHTANFIKDLADGKTFVNTKQDEQQAFYLTRNRSSNRAIDFNMTAYSVYNFIRAYMYPYSGAFIYHNCERVAVNIAYIENWQGNYGKAGEVINVNDYGVEVACGDGSIIIDKFLPEISLKVGDMI